MARLLNGCAIALLGGLGQFVLTPAAAAAEDATIRVFATWQADGRVIETGPGETSFTGILRGPVFIDGAEGPVRSGELLCTALLQVTTFDGRQTGSGRCTYSIADGSKAFANVSCSGVQQLGCHGDFTFTAGSGQFEGIGGGGKVMIRPEFIERGATSNSMSAETDTGTMFWPALHYTLP